MREKFIITIVALSLLWFSTGATAEKEVLQYSGVDGKLKYKDVISIQYTTDTDKIHASTYARVTNLISTNAVRAEGKILVKVEFNGITVDSFKREIQISDNEKRVLNTDLMALDAELKNQVLEKWVAVIIDDKGTPLQQFYSPDLNEVKLINLKQITEQLYIPFPEGEVSIGNQWKKFRSSVDIPFSGTIPLETTVKYTYLGTEMQNGIQCHKINAGLNLVTEKPLGEYYPGITWVSYSGSGMIYYAVDGNYLVKSGLTGDLSFMVLTDVADEGSYISFIRSKVEQNIELLSE